MAEKINNPLAALNAICGTDVASSEGPNSARTSVQDKVAGEASRQMAKLVRNVLLEIFFRRMGSGCTDVKGSLSTRRTRTSVLGASDLPLGRFQVDT